MAHEDPALVYKHIVVKRKSMANMTASSADLRALRDARSRGGPLPENLKHLSHLVVGNTIETTVKHASGKVGWQDTPTELIPSREELRKLTVTQLRAKTRELGIKGVGDRKKEDIIELIIEQDTTRSRDAWDAQRGLGAPVEPKPIRYGAQEGIIVASLQKTHVPGGSEPLPLTPTVLTHPGFSEAEDAMGDFKKAAAELQARFKKYSDNKFRLLDPEFQRGCTLVTVVYTPIMASPKLTRGMDLFCEFHQVTRFGYVDVADFEVYSDNGEFPVTPPGTLELAMLMKSADEILPAPTVE